MRDKSRRSLLPDFSRKVQLRYYSRAEAVIWNQDSAMLQQFEREAGHSLSPGNTVRLNATVRFHPAHGFAFIVRDIAPLYPLGEIERQRRATLVRLQAEGLTALNKDVPLAIVPQRVMVISATSAAGYGDFLSMLRHNPSGYSFSVCLIPAALQGRGAAASLFAALNKAAECADEYDVVAILRGGGSPEDLHTFNDHALAAAIARFPLPIITGIGHERDVTVADLVSHIALPTPTAAATFLIQKMQEFDNHCLRLQGQIHTVTRGTLRCQQEELEQRVREAVRETERILRTQERRLQAIAERLRRQSALVIARQEKRASVLAAQLSGPFTRGYQRHADITRLGRVLSSRSNDALRLTALHLESLRITLRDHHPRQVMKRGFCLLRREGQILLPPDTVRVGDVIEIEMLNGRLIARVERTEEKTMDPQQLPYPQAIARLEAIVQHMNEDAADLDTLVASVQEAAGLIKTCRRRLRTAQSEIDGALQEIEAEPSP